MRSGLRKGWCRVSQSESNASLFMFLSGHWVHDVGGKLWDMARTESGQEIDVAGVADSVFIFMLGSVFGNVVLDAGDM